MNWFQANQLLATTDLTSEQRRDIQNAFFMKGKSDKSEIKVTFKNGEPVEYKHLDFGSAVFKSEEEAIAIKAIANLAPEIREDSIFTIFGIMLKLMGKETGWEYTPSVNR